MRTTATPSSESAIEGDAAQGTTSAAGEPAAWHLIASEQVLQRLDSDPARGLSAEQAARRLEQVGGNEIEEGRRRGPLRLLLEQFTDFMILVLLAAALISGVIGDLADTLVILVIVVLNAAIGFVQAYRAERAIAALKAMAAPAAHVLRDGQSTTLPARELVPGDIVLLEAGNAVTADLRLIEAVQLSLDEAALTGESHSVDKHTRALGTPDLPLGDRRNMAYKGTLVAHGRGRGVVVATGMQTELGRIARLLREEEEVRTPLQKRLAHFGRVLSAAVLAICALLFVAGVLRGEPLMLMALTAISLAVAAIPEALPAVVTVALALGARRMVKRQALIRKLPAVETLGSVTTICSDKTGTLTLNRMHVEALWSLGETRAPPAAPRREPWTSLLRAAALSNDAEVDRAGEVAGDPTEVALYRAAADAGQRKEALLASMPRVAEIAFEAERARMTTLHRDGEAILALVKGSPEGLIPLCHDQLGTAGPQPFYAQAALDAAERMAAAGLRVLAFACRKLPRVPDPLTPESVENGLTFLGLAGMLDPPRPEAREAVALCRSAGITPVMITGDHPATARTIAAKLAVIDDPGELITGVELSRLTPGALSERAARVRVYARTSPEQKIAIVKALQARGEFVAMTGDGVNDAPALKRADIGVAMGISGTDVAKEAAHMILLDDNFASIVSAVREGRRIFDNIRKFIKYTMTSNSGEIWTLFLAPFLGLPIPLLPIHILWINLVTDGLPGLALAAEPEERGIMRRPPRPPGESIFAHGMWQHIVWVGLLMGGVCLLTQSVAIQLGWHWQTMVFTVLTLSQLGHALAVRAERDSLFTLGVRSNSPLLLAVLFTLALQLATIYWPGAKPLFKTEPLSAAELGCCLLMSSVVFLAVEVEKWLVRRGRLYRDAHHPAGMR
jgi:Ca2+-transporting ATPase